MKTTNKQWLQLTSEQKQHQLRAKVSKAVPMQD